MCFSIVRNTPVHLGHLFRGFFQTRAADERFLVRMASRLSVKCVPEEEKIHINLNYSHKGARERTFNLDRCQNEELGKSLARLKANIVGKLAKRKPKKKQQQKQQLAHSAVGHSASCATEEEEIIELWLYKNNEKIDETTLNKDAWVNGAALHIAEHEIPVIFNPPTVNGLKLPECVMAGFPVFLKFDVEFADVDLCEFSWFSIKPIQVVTPKNEAEKPLDLLKEGSKMLACDTKDEGEVGGVKTNMKSKAKKIEEEAKCKTNKNKSTNSGSPVKEGQEWTNVSHERIFTPPNSIIGHRLKVTCTPKNSEMSGQPESVESNIEINAGPGYCPFEKRHSYTKVVTPHGRFRIVSYNILADLYADSDFSRTMLFPYCPPYALHIDYRKQLFLKELTGYNADVICLQEVDRKVFVNDLEPAFAMIGLESLHRLKGGQVNEGMATIFRSSKFRLLGQHDMELSDVLQNSPAQRTLFEKVAETQSLKERILSKTTVLQVTALESVERPSHFVCVVTVLESVERPGHLVCVANTHLYFHPQANHIRLVQIIICMQHLEDVVLGYTKEGKSASLVFCGDFNSSPPVGVNEYMVTGCVSADHPDWNIAGEEECLKLEEGFRHKFSMESGCAYPVYTNYVGGFCGTLDYIYMDNQGLSVTDVIPAPEHPDVSQYTALPSIVFPSDHIAQICEVEFRNPSSASS